MDSTNSHSQTSLKGEEGEGPGGQQNQFDQVFQLSSDSFPGLVPSRKLSLAPTAASGIRSVKSASAAEAAAAAAAPANVPKSARLIFESRGRFKLEDEEKKEEEERGGEREEGDSEFVFAMDADLDSGFAAEYVTVICSVNDATHQAIFGIGWYFGGRPLCMVGHGITGCCEKTCSWRRV
jgi:hypothetical protein